MPRLIRTAVAAAASQASRMQIVRGLAGTDVSLDCMCKDGPSAFRALDDFRSELLITDAFLPGMDGQALAKRALCSFSLCVRPAVLILYDDHYALPERDLLERCGAVFLSRFAAPEDFVSAVKQLQKDDLRFTQQETRRMDMLLDSLGVPDHPGREYLKKAVLLCAADQRFRHRMGDLLYPKANTTCSMRVRQAERAMRHVIGLAWQSNKFDNQYRVFADTVDAGRGQPTCSEMILRLADILRLEG